MPSLFNSKLKIKPARPPKEISIREFSGGLNAIDNDISLSTKYAKELQNLSRAPDKSLSLRYGTRFIDDIKDLVSNGDVIDVHYFQGKLILVADTGEIAAIDIDGNRAVIWNTAIAALLPGAPSGWGTAFDQVTFVEFSQDLIIHNGVDKPLIIDSDVIVDYLQDPGSGSNTNVPIGKYGAAVSDYHCVAGIDDLENTIYVSSKGTSGVFPGDPPINDSISFDVGAKAGSGASGGIRGLSGYRNFLLAFFREVVVVMQLGTYNDAGDHTPVFLDTLPQVGVTGQRIIAPIENDILFADSIGVSSGKRNVFVQTVESTRVSALVAPIFQAAMGRLTQEQLLKNVFAVYNKLDKQYIIHDSIYGKTFVYTFDATLKVSAWSEFVGWQWTCGCQSSLGQVFYVRDSRVYMYGNLAYDEEFFADYIDDRIGNWANSAMYAAGDVLRDTDLDSSWICLIPHAASVIGTFVEDRADQPTFWEAYEGDAIDFLWEMPWVDAGQRQRIKKIGYISADTKGTAQFDFSIFVDFLHQDEDGVQIYDPAIVLPFVGGDIRGFGGTPEQPFGGGRRSTDARLWQSPVKFKTAKFVISGSTRNRLRMIALTILYSQGSYQR